MSDRKLQVQFLIFIPDNAWKGSVKVHLDIKIRFGRSAAVKRSISICNAKISSGVTLPQKCFLDPNFRPDKN